MKNLVDSFGQVHADFKEIKKAIEEIQPTETIRFLVNRLDESNLAFKKQIDRVEKGERQ